VAAVGDLVVNLLAKTDQFQSAISQARKNLTAFATAAVPTSASDLAGIRPEMELSGKYARELLKNLEQTSGPAKFLGLESERIARHIRDAASKTQMVHVHILDIVKGMFLMRGIMAAFASVGGMIRGAFDFEKELRGSQAIMGDLSETLDKKMRAAVLETAMTTKYSMAEAAKGLFYLASAGLDAEQSIAALPIAARFAMAGNMDFAKASETLSDVQAAMGLKVKDAVQNQLNMARVADVLVAANVKSQGTVEEFGIALTRAAPMAQALHRSLEETTAALMVLHDKGIKAEEAGTELSIIYRELADLGIKVPDQLEKLGVSIFKAGQMRPLADIVEDLTKAFAKLTDEEIKQTLASLKVEDRATRFILTLLGSSEKIRAWGNELKTAGGYAKTVADRQLDEIQKALHRLSVSAVEAGVNLRKRFGAGIVWISQALTGLVSKIPKAIEWIVKYGAAYAAFSLSAAFVGKVINIVTTFMKAWTAATRMQAKALAVLQALMGPKGWAQLIVGAAAAAAAIYGVDKAFASMEAQSMAWKQENYQSSKALSDLQTAALATADATKNAAPSVKALSDLQTAALATADATKNAAPSVMDLSLAVYQLKKNLAEFSTDKAEGFGKGFTEAIDSARLAVTLMASQVGSLNEKELPRLGAVGSFADQARAIESTFAELAKTEGLLGQVAADVANAFGRVASARIRLAAEVQDAEQWGMTQERMAAITEAYNKFNRTAKDTLVVLDNLKGKFGETLEAFEEPGLKFGASDPFKNMQTAISAANEALKAAETPLAKYERELKKIESLGKLFPATFTPAIRSDLAKKAREEFERETGVTAKRHELESRVKALREKIATPEERFAKQRQEIQDLLAQKQITEPEATRALALLEREQKGQKGEAQTAGALRAGSAEAWSTILTSMMHPGKTKAEEETAANTRHLEKLRDIRELLDRMANRPELVATF